VNVGNAAVWDGLITCKQVDAPKIIDTRLYLIIVDFGIKQTGGYVDCRMSQHISMKSWSTSLQPNPIIYCNLGNRKVNKACTEVNNDDEQVDYRSSCSAPFSKSVLEEQQSDKGSASNLKTVIFLRTGCQDMQEFCFTKVFLFYLFHLILILFFALKIFHIRFKNRMWHNIILYFLTFLWVFAKKIKQ